MSTARPRRLRSRRNPAAALDRAAAAVTSAAATAAAAASIAWTACGAGITYTYTGADGGNWNTAANWIPAGGPPAMGDTANFITSSATDFTINFNRVYVGTGLTSLFIDPAGPGNLILSQTLSTSVMIADSELLGDHADLSAAAIYTQSTGSNTVNTLTLGNNSGGNGVYNQSGGVNNVASILYLGFNAGSVGTYNLSANGSLSGVAEFIGASGTGIFNQTGGSNSVTNLSVGDNGGSTGTYNLSNSASLLSASGQEVIGGNGTGTFNHTGGRNLVVTLLVGGSALSAYNLSNSGLLTASSGELVALFGIGAFNQTGGSNSTSLLAIAPNTGASGTYTLSGNAFLSVMGNEVLSDLGGNAVFNQLGGTHTISGTLVISSDPGMSTGTFNLQGGSLSAGTIKLNDGGTFNQTGGTLSYTTFNMAGGTVTGTLQNQGTFNYTNGTFSGRLLNQGVVNLGPSFTAGNGMENDSVLTVAIGQTITLSGAGLDNEGTLTMAGGNLVLSTTAVNVNHGNFTLSATASFQLGTASFLNGGSFNLDGSLVNGSGPLTNAAGGTMNGPGTITAAFTNAGGTLVVRDGTLNVINSFANSGYIQLAGFTANLTGGTITNTGTIQGIGTVANPLDNAGTVEAIGGTLALSGPLANNAGGLLATSTGSKLLFTSGLGINAGAITLTGGTFDNNGHLLFNHGSIDGYGTFRSGGLTNSPGNVITFTGGFTSISGDVTNTAGATIRAALNPVLFTGNVVNNGIIKVTGAPTNTVTIAGGYSGSGSYVSDPADNYFLSAVNVGSGGQVLGATGDRFFIAGTYNNAGTYSNGGGLLSAQDVVNDGSFTQSADQATMLALSGTGTTVVGGLGTSLVSVASLAQDALTINAGGTVQVRVATPRVTNSVSTLTITGTGLLDLGNHALLVHNATTPESLVHQYLHNAYNADASGIGNWLGKGGITSSDAIASHNGPSPDFRISVGYVNGNYANDPLIAGPIPGQETLPTNRTLIRPALYGDLNLDGRVDDTDLAIFSGLGQYNQPTDKFGWLGGDLNQDGKVDDTDLLIFSGAGNYNGPSYGAATAAPAHASATPSLTGHTESNGDIVLSASTSAGVPGDGILDFVYNPSTGHLTLSYDGDPRVTASQPFQVVRFKSAGGHFVPGNFNQTAFGAGVTATTTALNGTASGSNSVPDGYDMGAVLPTGLTVSDLTSDLTLQWNVFGGGLTLKNGDVVVPEPAALALFGAGAASLSVRRRRRSRR